MLFAAASQADRAAMEALWKMAFPSDSKEDIARFFDCFFAADTALVARDGEAVASMLFLLPTTLEYHGERRKVGYIYAGATHPAYRGGGLYRALLEQAKGCARAQGMAALLLRPADELLFESYRRMGYTFPVACSTFDGECDAQLCESAALPLSAAQYTAARRVYLRDRDVPFIDWEERYVAYACEWCQPLQVGSDAVALIGDDDQAVYMWEWLCDDRNSTALHTVCASCDCSRYAGRAVGEETVIGLLHPLDTALFETLPFVYMGYGLE